MDLQRKLCIQVRWYVVEVWGLQQKINNFQKYYYKKIEEIFIKLFTFVFSYFTCGFEMQFMRTSNLFPIELKIMKPCNHFSTSIFPCLANNLNRNVIYFSAVCNYHKNMLQLILRDFVLRVMAKSVWHILIVSCRE